ncbi:MAG: PEP-CTERM sorting domain-containing protein [Thermoguttaceae bacterium]|jgi:hypothetical protein
MAARGHAVGCDLQHAPAGVGDRGAGGHHLRQCDAEYHRPVGRSRIGGLGSGSPVWQLHGHGKYPDGSSAVISAALFDQRGLYEGPTANGPWTYDDATQVDPGFSEVSCISARLGWIEGIVPDVAAPEPGTLLMLISAAFSLAVFGRFARRRK